MPATLRLPGFGAFFIASSITLASVVLGGDSLSSSNSDRVVLLPFLASNDILYFMTSYLYELCVGI